MPVWLVLNNSVQPAGVDTVEVFDTTVIEASITSPAMVPAGLVTVIVAPLVCPTDAAARKITAACVAFIVNSSITVATNTGSVFHALLTE